MANNFQIMMKMDSGFLFFIKLIMVAVFWFLSFVALLSLLSFLIMISFFFFFTIHFSFFILFIHSFIVFDEIETVPVINMTWGNIGFVNGINVLNGPDPYTLVFFLLLLFCYSFLLLFFFLSPYSPFTLSLYLKIKFFFNYILGCP